MTLEPIELRRPRVSKGSRKTKSIIVIGGIVLTFIVVFGVASGLSTGLYSSPTKQVKYSHHCFQPSLLSFLSPYCFALNRTLVTSKTNLAS